MKEERVKKEERAGKIEIISTGANEDSKDVNTWMCCVAAFAFFIY